MSKLNITWQGVLAGVLIGLVLQSQIQRLPLVSKIPQV